MKIDKKAATNIVREEASSYSTKLPDPVWIAKIEKLSRLCAEGTSSTHIAFLGTAILAKAVNRKADLFAIKPTHEPDNPNAYSARTLCHEVLVPLAAEIGFSLGVNGREPLNNQPYFRMNRLGDDTPIHRGAKPAFEYMLELISELNNFKNEADAREVLRAYIAVRNKHQPRYALNANTASLTPDQLIDLVYQFVKAKSEGGRRAQAAVAGLMDIFAGPLRIKSGRINDPSREYPGDVVVYSIDLARIEKAIEVRDKPVSISDVYIFCKKCVDMSVQEACVVMVAEGQVEIDEVALANWAREFGIGITLFYGWRQFVNQILFWSAPPKPLAAIEAVNFIHQRLIDVEVLPESVEEFQTNCKLYR
jgi:hypothetical protein